MVEILEKLTEGKATIEDFNKMKSLAQTMKTTSFCGLGQSAPVPVITLIKYFEEEFLEHINGKCRTGVCHMSV